MSDCIFCKIVSKQIPAKLVFEDSDLIVFHDIYPKAPTHLLVVPKKHIPSLAHLEPEDTTLMGKLTVKLGEIAKEQGLSAGFRTIINTGPGGGQEVFHIHYHLLGGKTLGGL
jgi:histidine triad (HIT) family protein